MGCRDEEDVFRERVTLLYEAYGTPPLSPEKKSPQLHKPDRSVGGFSSSINSSGVNRDNSISDSKDGRPHEQDADGRLHEPVQPLPPW